MVISGDRAGIPAPFGSRMGIRCQGSYRGHCPPPLPFWRQCTTLICDFENVADMSSSLFESWGVKCRDGVGDKTAPVGSFKPNAFGLFDILGNVSEWTQDCYNPNYDGLPSDGSAFTSGNCNKRVVRGGSWYHGYQARSAARYGKSPDSGGWTNGFRVVRVLSP